MKHAGGSFCISPGVESLQELRAGMQAVPPDIALAELRLDRFVPEDVQSGAWKELAKDPGRTWVFTWRSPEEGGAAPRPPGIHAAAVEAGFPWVDVEARGLSARIPEMEAVPVERRWVSLHTGDGPSSREAALDAWNTIRCHEGALHKLVFPSEEFAVNDWALDVVRKAAREGAPRSVFAQGWAGHVSRILGFLEGNTITFVGGDSGGSAPGQPTVQQVLKQYQLPRLAEQPALYGVVGNPAHMSLSPRLHNHAFMHAGHNGLYVPLESPRLEPVLRWVREGKLSGVSVTAPFKERAFNLVDTADTSAGRLQAVNTISLKGDELVGGNTDVEAAAQMLAAMRSGGGRRLALLGAGGAAAAVAGAAADHELDVTIYNRSGSRGRQLADRFGARWAGPPHDFDPAEFEMVVNATPMGVHEPIPGAVLRRPWTGTAILDLAYGDSPSGWQDLAAKEHCMYQGGREFLIRQAVGQFKRWTGLDIPTSVFEKGLLW